MDHHHQQQHHYDDEEHDEQLDSEYDEDPEEEWLEHNNNESQADGADDDYDGELNMNHYAHQTGYDDDHGHQNADYEPPSPSYPYPEDQQPPESDLPQEDIDDPDFDDNDQQARAHIRHSEIYQHDAVSGTMADRDSSIISEYLRSKDPGWDSVDQRTEPQNLLDLPVDILRLIVKEASQTHPTTCFWAVPHVLLFSCGSPSSVTSFTDDQLPDHPYQRFDFACPDQLDLPQLGHSSHLLALRHRLARRPHDGRRCQERRCFDVRPVNLVHGKCLCPYNETVPVWLRWGTDARRSAVHLCWQ